MVYEIIKVLELVTLPQNHVVFKEKTVGTAFYMVSKVCCQTHSQDLNGNA